MIILTFRGRAAPGNSNELFQSLTTMLGRIRKVKGCLNCYCYQNVENEYEFCFIEKWSTQEHMNTYMRSDLYGALQGAFKILTNSTEIEVNRVEDTTDSSLLPSGKP